MFSKIKKYLNYLKFINNTFTFIFNINLREILSKNLARKLAKFIILRD
ncbi:hypothetical protein CCS77_1877 [Campylobacter concisus]|uniref:Uncharacterized protein n=1 Tax=Campylobacter concisus TaxID=199 RepID=A0A2R4P2M6_9BACT|nr:hypothetical protein CCS77_1877 [Campylobacter concisus]